MGTSMHRVAAMLFALALAVGACSGAGDTEQSADAPPDLGGDAGEGGAGEGGQDGEAVTITIESWRTDDQAAWEETILPAFEEAHPEIDVEFAPTLPTEYNAALESKLAAGTAGDIISCRAFDITRELHSRGYFAPLNDLEGLENFSDLARSAWQTEDGSETICVPAVSTIHGFYYNVDHFNELGLTPPATIDEFYALLDELQQAGDDVAPLAWGTGDEWIGSETAFSNVGPNFYQGEEGRQGLIDGTKKYTDPEFVAVWEFLDGWQEYFPSGYEAITYEDLQQMFGLGRAAVWPSGSWDITTLRSMADFEIGVFRPPVPSTGDQCYISDHIDLGMGMNADTEHPDAVRTFLEWITAQEFADLMSNSLPGLFSASDHQIQLDDELAQQFVDFRDECESSVRINIEKLSSGGDPTAEMELQRMTGQMWNEDVPPGEVAATVQQALEAWYEPQQQ